MVALWIDLGAAEVSARIITGDGSAAGRNAAGLELRRPQPGWVELAPEQLWRATLSVVGAALAEYDGPAPIALHLTDQPATLVVWDSETLGIPRPAFATQDDRADGTSWAARLSWLAEQDPHTWALVQAGRYAVGSVGSYLVARMTRGTWHLVDAGTASRTQLLDVATGEWSQEVCSTVGVPVEALPEVVPADKSWARTDPVVFLGLTLPVTGALGDR